MRKHDPAADVPYFETFCAGLALAPSPEAVTLYLTAQLSTGRVHGGGLRYRLGLLDLHARLCGLPVPSQDPDLRRYLRGLHREAALASPEKGVDPLHTETLHVVLDAIARPRPQQVRDVALLLIANGTGLPAQTLAKLRWDAVRFRPTSVEIAVPPTPARGPRTYSPLVVHAPGGQLCPREALLRWRRASDPGNGPVFGLDGRSCDVHKMRPVLRLLGPPPGPADIGRLRATRGRLTALTGMLLPPQPRAIRDRALLLLAFTAALGTDDTRLLVQRHIRVVDQGLLVRLPGRADEWTAVPASRNGRHCPARAWQDWHDLLASRGLTGPDRPAFVQIAGVVVKREPLAEQGLNLLVRQDCETAGLVGDYAFTSLRIGFIRTAIRGGAPEHLVGRQAGLSALRNVTTHAHREQLIRQNAAGLVGL